MQTPFHTQRTRIDRDPRLIPKGLQFDANVLGTTPHLPTSSTGRNYMVHIKVYCAREEDREAWSKTMFSRMDPTAPKRLVAEFDLRYTATQGTRGSPTPEEVADFVFAGFNGVGKPLETFLKAGIRFMSGGDLLEIEGLKLLCTLTGFRRLP